MKAIAEYFRDLAAGDRFFGAEPPQPDTEMLHRIAEQTIQSRVNAEVTDNSLILRQDHSQPNATPAPVAAVAPVAAAEPAPVFEPAAPAPVSPQPEVTAPSAFNDGESIAAKLQRIRAVVSRETAEPAEVTTSYSEDEHADDFSSQPSVAPQAAADMYEDEEELAPPAIDTAEPVEDVTPEGAEPEAVAELVEAEAAIADEVVEEAAEETVSEAVEEDGSAELDTAALLSKLVDNAAEEDTSEAVEDEAEDVFTSDADSANDAEEMTAEAEMAQTVVAETEDAQDDAAEEDAVLNLLADTEAPAEVAEDAPTLATPRRRIIVQKISRAEVEAAQSKDSAEPEVEAEAEPSAELDADAEAALMRELAAVEADMEADVAEASEAPAAEDEDDVEARALAAAQAAQDATDTEAEANAAEEAAAEATAQAEAKAQEEADALAKVMAEAAEVEAELNGPVSDIAEGFDADGEVEPDTEADDENRASRIARRSAMVEDEDAALNRLMDATSSRLSDDDEGAVRRASIAHLKAAVAATKADDSIAQAAADEEEREMDQYRSDLARVVRPGRARPRSEGASTSRPSPLVLVSEQRIDAAEPDAAAAAAIDVRPRRITSGNLALQEELEDEAEETLHARPDVESFGEFAARYAALELPDILEAAAAHFTFVEDTPNFTRPMLMRKIAAITVTEPPSREAGLRSFGSLLREGRIVKGEDGKFVISGKSRFTPEALEAGE